MIKKLSIENYKSIKSMHIDCKKLNVFIGDTNTGKSNILEALSFFSTGALEMDVFPKLFRFKTLADLFFDYGLTESIDVETDDLVFSLSYGKDQNGQLTNHFLARYSDTKWENPNIDYSILLEQDGRPNRASGRLFETLFRTYIFQRQKNFSQKILKYLNPPFGDNLPSLLLTNNELRKSVSALFREKGYRLQLKMVENDINISKEMDEELYSYPYYSVSETLQRIVFMMMAIDSNRNSILVFDEPEANTFPFYTKYIAERIALDETNQFFLTTHNPYLLMSLIEKTKLSDLNVFVCEMKDYKTVVRKLSDDEVQTALDLGSDVFYNLNDLSRK